LFTASAAGLRGRYPRLGDFRRLMHSCDPSGKFRNDFLDRCLAPDR
jgi:alditol oxidase